jgi:hypothetical protein
MNPGWTPLLGRIVSKIIIQNPISIQISILRLREGAAEPGEK